MSISSFGFSAAFDDESKPHSKRRFDNKSRNKKSGPGSDERVSRSRRPEYDEDDFSDTFADFDEDFDEDEDEDEDLDEDLDDLDEDFGFEDDDDL